MSYDKTTAFKWNDWECEGNKIQISYMHSHFALSRNEQDKGSVILLVIQSHLLANLALTLKKEDEGQKVNE